MTAEDEAVVRQIREAFANVSRPEPAALENRHCCECAETAAAYIGKRWEEIGLADLLAGRETSLLTAAAWKYYLPAVMIWAIRDPAAVDVIADNLVYQLEPPGDDHGVREWFAERSTGFSPAQRAAVVAYLDWYRRREEVEWADAPHLAPRHVYQALQFWSGRGQAS